MIIKSLRMKNFRQFKGETKVFFSCDQEKNVTIILGDNTFGKTTLLQAFNWCFYGKAIFNQNSDFLLNYEVEIEMKNDDEQSVEVEIVVNHNSIEYIITRTQRYRCTNNKVRAASSSDVKVSYKEKDGQTEPVKAVQVKNVINNILPEELSTYFFFDTERVSSISTRKDVAEAVKGLLGLTALDNAAKHLGEKSKKATVIGKLYATLDTEGDTRAQKALEEIHRLEENRKDNEEKLEECNSQIEDYEKRKEQLEHILSENRTTSQLQKQMKDRERLIENEKKTLSNKYNSYFREFNQGSLYFFAQPLMRKASEYLHKAKIDDKGVKDLTKNVILELINRGKCLCGQDIVEGNEAYNHLLEEMRFVPPESIGNSVRHYRENIESFSNFSLNTYSNLEEKYNDILRCKERIAEWEDEIFEIGEQIKGKENMANYELELSDAKKALRDLQSKKDRLNNNKGSISNEIARWKRIYEQTAGASEKNKETLMLLGYGEKLRDWFIESYKSKEKIIHDMLEDEVNNIFGKMYHGRRRVSINSNYEVKLIATVADTKMDTGESEGSNRVKNFAFIAGLVSLAKKRIISDNNDVDLSSEPYPLVMDAPFSNADETHTMNISKILPEVAEQVIMFVMQKDWNYAEKVMKDKVGKSYRLSKVSETYTELKQEADYV